MKRETKDENVDDLSPFYGEFGRWQAFVFAVINLLQIPGVMTIFVMTFFTPNIDYWCSRPDHLNVSVNEWRNYSSPLVENGEDEMIRDRCRVYKRNDSEIVTDISNDTEIVDCDSWEYDLGIYKRTMREEFDIVCSRDVLISTSNAIFMAGFMVGVFVNGHLSDRFGRRWIIIINVAGQSIFSIAMAFSNTFEVFVVLRGFQCFSGIGASVASFVLFTEICSGRYRATLGNCVFVGYALGMMLFAGISYALVNWFHIQLLIAIINFTCVLFVFFLPESPRWLITCGRLQEAEKIILNASRINGIKNVDKTNLESVLRDLYEQEMLKKSKKSNKSHSFVDLLRTPNMRKKTLNMCFCWAVNAFVYYGLSFNTNDLGGDPFINFLISAAVEIPAYIMSGICVYYVGRKYPLLVVMIIGGLGCAATIVIPQDMKTLKIIFPMIGKFCITGSFGMIYVYAAEIFPTVTRSIGMSSCSMIARVGSIVAPYVKELGIYTHKSVPPAVYGVLSIISGLLVLLLPETKNQIIPDTLDEAEIITRSNPGILRAIHSEGKETELLQRS